MADVPQNIPAEQSVLGAVLVSRDAFATARAVLSDDDWYRPQHLTIWQACCAVADKGDPVDALTVGAYLVATNRRLASPLPYLADLVTTTLGPGSITHHAHLIVDAAIRRRVIEAGTRIVQRAYEADDRDIAELLLACQGEVDAVVGLDTGATVSGLYGWHEFLAKFANRQDNWVVPGFVGRKDVWMILAPPGAGKTFLSRHMCWAIATGVHPWYPTREIEPKRTLLVDLENDEGMAADDSVEFFPRLDNLGQGTEGRGYIWARPQGLNLRDASAALLLDKVLSEVRPDFVAFGSLYKAFQRGGDSWDHAADEARAVFDRVRTKHQIAFWIEHHMPKAQAGQRASSPFGSSIWEWWTSHGRVLERTVPGNTASPFSFTAPFRGDRGKRECPVGFTRGGRHALTPIWDQGELDVLTEGCT